MPRKILFARIVDRKNPKHLSLDPAQFGAFRATISAEGNLTLTGPRNIVVFRDDHVTAVRWENEETLLYVKRQASPDEPLVKRAFKSRLHRDWDCENVDTASAVFALNTPYVAVTLSQPNPSVGILPLKSPVQAWPARINLGTVPTEISWGADKKSGLTVNTPDAIYTWLPGQTRFTRTVKS